MYSIFTYIWDHLGDFVGANVGKYSIHGAYGHGSGKKIGILPEKNNLPGKTWSTIHDFGFVFSHRSRTKNGIVHPQESWVKTPMNSIG